MELSSALSTNLWNKSQSATESLSCGAGLERAVRSRVPSTRACRGKIMVAWLCLWWVGGGSGRSSGCATATDGWDSERVNGGGEEF